MTPSLICPCSSRSPWRRKKNCLLLAIPVMAVIAFMQMLEVDEVYTPFHPLSDAKSEARRLLNVMTHYNYRCNATLQVGNASVWPICMDRGVALNLNERHKKLLYTIGSVSDYALERSLAANYSFSAYLVTAASDVSSQVRGANNTHVVRTTIVANDPADFSRNAYGQRTLNDLLAAQGHSHVDLLRLMSTTKNVEMWQLLYFLIKDDLVSKVNQLQLAVYIDKLDDEHLYNWYRTLYQLFTRSGMYLYHTSSHDPLCLQVTLMESCVYFLSFVRNPGPKVFVLYPPADYGTEEQEDLRLFDYLDTPQVTCKQRTIGRPKDDANLRFPSKTTWQICRREGDRNADAATPDASATAVQLPCSVVRFRFSREPRIEEHFARNRCSVYTVILSSRSNQRTNLRLHARSAVDNQKAYRTMSWDAVFRFLNGLGTISLIEVDVPDNEWFVIGEILNSGILQNVTQLVAGIMAEDKTSGVNPLVLRSHYSQLRRVESYGLALFYSRRDWHCQRLDVKDVNGINAGVWCYRVGYVRLRDL